MRILNIIVCLALVTGATCSYASFEDHREEFLQKPEKLAAWESMIDEINSCTDALGLPIDQRIKETVIVINLLGFKTSQSCEGHLNWGCPFPWVEIAVMDEDLSALYEQNESLAKRISEAKNQGDLEECQKLCQERLAVANKIDLNRYNKNIGIQNLLEEFYREQATSYENMLILKPHKLSRVEPLAGDFAQYLPEEQKAEKLQVFQKEMERFTDFLIVHYVNQ